MKKQKKLLLVLHFPQNYSFIRGLGYAVLLFFAGILVVKTDATAEVSTLGNAQQQFRSGNTILAIKSFSNVLSKDKNNAMALFGRAMAYYTIKQYNKAKLDLDAAIKINPANAIFYVRRGHVYTKLENYDASIEDFTVAIKINPASGFPYFHRANLYAAMGRKLLALADYKKNIRYSPSHVESYVRRGKLYWLLGNELAAIRDFDTLLNGDLKINISNTIKFILTKQQEADVLLYHAYSLINMGGYKKAFDDYEKVIASGFYKEKALIGRASLYRKLGKFNQAIADYNTVIQLRPNWAAAYFNRANALRSVKEEESAINDYKKAVAITSGEIEKLGALISNGNMFYIKQDPALFITRAKAYTAMGKKKAAIRDFTTAYEIFKVRKDQFSQNSMAIEIEKLTSK